MYTLLTVPASGHIFRLASPLTVVFSDGPTGRYFHSKQTGDKMCVLYKPCDLFTLKMAEVSHHQVRQVRVFIMSVWTSCSPARNQAFVVESMCVYNYHEGRREPLKCAASIWNI